MNKYINIISIAVLAIICIMTPLTKVSASDLTIPKYTTSINSDTQIAHYGDYYFKLDKPGIIEIGPSTFDSNGHHEYLLYKYDEATGVSALISSDNSNWYSTSEWNRFRVGKGLYYIEMKLEYFTVGYLRINYYEESTDTTEQEWNDSFDLAQNISLNTQYSASSLCGDYDYYKFTIYSPGSLYYTMSQNDLNGFYEGTMELYSEDANGNVSLLNSLDLIDQIATSSKLRLKAGTYFLKEQPTYELNHYYNLDYKFKVVFNAEAAGSFETESNNLVTSANLIQTNQGYTGNIQSADDSDYYKFTIDTSNQVSLQFTQPRETKEKTYRIDLLTVNEDDEVVSINSFVTSSNTVNVGDTSVLLPGDYYIRISATTEDNISMTDYKVMVNATPVTLINTITLTPSITPAYTGTIMNLVPTILPTNADNITLLWTSSDTGIAKVNRKGKVTCVSSGECYIYANATDGSNVIGKYRLIVKKDPNNNLKSINYSTGLLSKSFSPNITDYTLTINRESSVSLSFTKESKYAKCYINDKKISKTIVKLKPGSSKKVEVAIVAENGEEKDYTIVVTRKK